MAAISNLSFFRRVRETGAKSVGPAHEANAATKIAAIRETSGDALPVVRRQVAPPRPTADGDAMPGADTNTFATKDLLDVSRRELTLLTATDGHPLNLDPETRKSIVVFSDMTMVVAKAHRNYLIVSDVLNRARENGHPIERIKVADFEVIAQIYGLSQTVDTSNVDFTKNQQALYERIQDAAKQRASDIHLKIDGATAKLAHSIKGDFTHICDMPAREAEYLFLTAFNACKTGDKQYNPLKYIAARLDNSDDFKLPPGVQALRLQFSPLDNNGRELVARLLYKDNGDELGDIDQLGYRPPQLRNLNAMRRQAYGIILVTGPTGSGKSTTLKVALEKTYLDRKGLAKIVTLEDPPEYVIRGSSQMPIDSGTTLDDKAEAFTRAISAMLRMAPHIVMIGEMREERAARATFDAAKTGHLVWTTVHANTALDSIIRVRDMQIKDIDLEDPHLMRGLIAQRLVKSLCPHCALPFNEVVSGQIRNMQAEFRMDEAVSRFYADLGPAATANIRVAKAGGCPQCATGMMLATGHSGRRVVAETIVPDRHILRAVTHGDVEKAQDLWLRQPDAVTMLEHGLQRVLTGEVDPRDLTYVGDVTRDIRKERIELVLDLLAD